MDRSALLHECSFDGCTMLLHKSLVGSMFGMMSLHACH